MIGVGVSAIYLGFRKNRPVKGYQIERRDAVDVGLPKPGGPPRYEYRALLIETAQESSPPVKEFYRSPLVPQGPFSIVEEEAIACAKCSELSEQNRRLKREVMDLRARNIKLELELREELNKVTRVQRLARLFRGAS
jgi:hypothetical protein